MPSTSLIPLTNNRDSSSAGALQTNYTTLCDPQLFQPIETFNLASSSSAFGDAFRVGVNTCLQNFHTLGTSGEVFVREIDKGRLVSHYFLAQLPDLAVKEAFTSLQSIWEFYLEPAAASLALPNAAKKSGKVSKKYQRADIVAEE